MKRTRPLCRTALFRIGLALWAVILFGLLPGAAWPAAGSPSPGMRAASVPVYGYRVVHVFPHDRQAYTQGLVWCDGFLYEGTGLYGASDLRKVRLETGRVIERRPLDRNHFGEGIAEWEGRLFQLTWTSQMGFIYDRAGLKPRGSFRYSGEGWGLARDGRRLIMSDGTSGLRFLDPESLRETGRLEVRDDKTPLTGLNELEFVRGEIFANVYRTDRIARISPRTGNLTGWIDLSGLLTETDRILPVDVLNGIAYDGRTNRLFVTGKLWPKLFEIELIRR